MMQDPVLEKMQQLMQKYQGQPDSTPAARSLVTGNAVPILRNIVKLGDAIPPQRDTTDAPFLSTKLINTLHSQIEQELQAQLKPLLAEHLQRVLTQAIADSLPELQQQFQTLIHDSVQHALDRQGLPTRDKS